MGFRSGKNFVHSLGLSCCFRQWRAEGTHCRFLHGYALQVEFEFERTDKGVDKRNWVMGFGDLRPVKAWLEEHFDHKTLIAEDDPYVKRFKKMQEEGLIQLRLVKHVGIEYFAHDIFVWVRNWLHVNAPGVELQKVTVREHEGNWASYDGSIS